MALHRHRRQLIAAAPQKMPPSRIDSARLTWRVLNAVGADIGSFCEAPSPVIPGNNRAPATQLNRRVADARFEAPIKHLDARVQIAPVWEDRPTAGCRRTTSVNASSHHFPAGLDLAAPSRLRGSKGKAAGSAPLAAYAVATSMRPLCCRAVIRLEALRRDFPPGAAHHHYNLGVTSTSPAVGPSLARCCRREAGAQSHGPGARWWRSGASTKPDARERGAASPRHHSASRCARFFIEISSTWPSCAVGPARSARDSRPRQAGPFFEP
jgi:hypothetical protein